MILKRKIYDKLLSLKKTLNGKKAFLIEGARRIGKSTICEEFGKNEYKSYILIDFARCPDEVKDYFLKHMNDLDTFFMLLSTYYGVKLYERESLIIFDEVQMFPKARECIKYLVADGRYDYIETGSLISIKENVRDIVIPSEERHLKMYPLDFEEFCEALGEAQIISYIRKCFEERVPLENELHYKAMLLFKQYILVGGMPQAVKEYVKTKNFEAVDAVKRMILHLYRDDIQKHAKGYHVKVKAIFDEIPSQLKNQKRHFKLSALKSGARFSEYQEPLFWLEDAMIVNNCYNATEPSLGLRMNRDRTVLKCYMADTGLLISHAFDENGIMQEEIYRKLMLDKLEVNLGMVVENAVAQMLIAAGHKLYFYTNSDRENKENRMEIDFLVAKSKITNRHNISPIEVKSGKNYTLSSLKKFISIYNEQLFIPFVLHDGDLKEEDSVVYLPLYMTALL